MSDVQYFDPEDFEGLREKQATVPRSQIRRWEQESKRLHELEDRLEGMEKERVFTEAGVPSDGAGAWFRKGYDGELTIEAVRQAFGVPAPDQSTNQSLAGHRTARDLSAGADTAGTTNALAELKALQVKARQRKNAQQPGPNAQNFEQLNAELNELLSRENVPLSPDTANWKLPPSLMS